MASSTTMVRPGEIVQAAISRGDLARVRDLLRNGASATERGRHDTTALHWAAAANEAAIVRELLDHGADPNARAADGCSALHYAAREDAAEAVNALLAGGADARATNREGRTPLQEVYDEEDEDGAATARALRDGEKSKALFSFDANATETKDSRSVGACTKGSDAAETKKRATSFGPTNSAADDALERAMEDMARLLRAEKGASPAGPNAETTASQKTTRSSSGSGATDSGARENGGSFKTLTARKYVPAASHTLPGCDPKTKASVRVRLGPDGRLAAAEYEKLKDAYLATAPGFPGNEKESGVSYDRVPLVAVAKADARRGVVRLGDAS
jgi:ketosteroid isomerase-like protein